MTGRKITKQRHAKMEKRMKRCLEQKDRPPGLVVGDGGSDESSLSGNREYACFDSEEGSKKAPKKGMLAQRNEEV